MPNQTTPHRGIALLIGYSLMPFAAIALLLLISACTDGDPNAPAVRGRDCANHQDIRAYKGFPDLPTIHAIAKLEQGQPFTQNDEALVREWAAYYGFTTCRRLLASLHQDDPVSCAEAARLAGFNKQQQRGILKFEAGQRDATLEYHVHRELLAIPLPQCQDTLNAIGDANGWHPAASQRHSVNIP